MVRMECPAWCSGDRRPLIAGCLSLRRLVMGLPVTCLAGHRTPPASESRSTNCPFRNRRAIMGIRLYYTKQQVYSIHTCLRRTDMHAKACARRAWARARCAPCPSMTRSRQARANNCPPCRRCRGQRRRRHSWTLKA